MESRRELEPKFEPRRRAAAAREMFSVQYGIGRANTVLEGKTKKLANQSTSTEPHVDNGFHEDTVIFVKPHKPSSSGCRGPHGSSNTTKIPTTFSAEEGKKHEMLGSPPSWHHHGPPATDLLPSQPSLDLPPSLRGEGGVGQT